MEELGACESTLANQIRDASHVPDAVPLAQEPEPPEVAEKLPDICAPVVAVRDADPAELTTPETVNEPPATLAG